VLQEGISQIKECPILVFVPKQAFYTNFFSISFEIMTNDEISAELLHFCRKWDILKHRMFTGGKLYV